MNTYANVRGIGNTRIDVDAHAVSARSVVLSSRDSRRI
jgi:hypothetical protein